MYYRVSTEKSKVLIDLGHNLPQGDEPVEDKMDNPATIEALCEGCNAIFYTHYHGDHVDLFRHVPDTVPQYIGPLAKQVMGIKLKHLVHVPGQQEQRQADVARLESFRTFEAAKPVPVGEDIRITPYFVSHSAADAYMFLIEADGKHVLHTGDFRRHGYLSKGLLPTHTAYNPKTKAFVDRFPNFEYLHTSGHATTDTLAEVCRTINPSTAIIPIHREKDSDFASLDIGDELRSRVATTSQTVDEIEIVVK